MRLVPDPRDAPSIDKSAASPMTALAALRCRPKTGKEKAPGIAARGRDQVLAGPEETFGRSELLVTIGRVNAVDNQASGGNEYKCESEHTSLLNQ